MVTSIGYVMQRSSVPIRQNPNQWIANIILVIIHTLYWLLLPATNHSLWGKSFVVDDYYPDKNLIFDHKSPQARSSFSSIAISDPISQVLLVNLQQNPHSHHDSLAKQVPLKHSHVCSGSFAVLNGNRKQMIHLAGFHWVRHSGHLVATCCERHHLRVAGMFQSAGGRHRNDGWYRGIIPEWMAELCHQNTFLYIYVLVAGLEHEFYDFPSIGNFIIPTDELHDFSEG